MKTALNPNIKLSAAQTAELKSLYAQRLKIAAQIDQIESPTKRDASRALVGKCFVTVTKARQTNMTPTGGLKTTTVTWRRFCRVVESDDSSGVNTIQFELTHDGDFHYYAKRWCHHWEFDRDDTSWKSCTLEAYASALRAALSTF